MEVSVASFRPPTMLAFERSVTGYDFSRAEKLFLFIFPSEL
jgi:hypothetical protein